MTDESPVSLSRGLPETVIAEVPREWSDALEAARRLTGEERAAALAELAAAHPRYLDCWAELAEGAAGPIEGYAYARVGYHRGLDTLRASGWRGTGYVRWRNPTNRGFLSALEALRRYAGEIGEEDEEDRCALFLRQLDPDWDRSGPGASA